MPVITIEEAEALLAQAPVLWRLNERNYAVENLLVLQRGFGEIVEQMINVEGVKAPDLVRVSEMFDELTAFMAQMIAGPDDEQLDQEDFEDGPTEFGGES